jgi:hypothetical protein
MRFITGTTHVVFVSGVDVSFWVKVSAAPITNETDGALAWIGVPIFDGVIFFLTLYKAFTLGKGVRLLDMIVRDGASNRISCTRSLIIVLGTMYFSYELFCFSLIRF